MSLNNFGAVSARIFRGAQPDERSWQTLRALSVNVVVKLNSEAEYPRARESQEAGPNIEVWAFEVNQWAPDLEKVRAVVNQIRSYEATQTGRIFVHCTHGRDRTGLIIGAYRLIVNGWTFEQVQAERASYGVTGIIALADHEIAEALEAIADARPVEQ